MENYGLQNFIADWGSYAASHSEPSDVIRAITPLMDCLLRNSKDLLRGEHFQSDPNHYARNLVYADEKSGLSLYALVWLPSQWTPVHDHGTWGVVGVIEGQLEEQS